MYSCFFLLLPLISMENQMGIPLLKYDSCDIYNIIPYLCLDI